MKPKNPNPFRVHHGLPPRPGYALCKKTKHAGGAVERVLLAHGRSVRPSCFFGSVYLWVPNELVAECLEAIKEVQPEIDAEFRRINGLPNDWVPPGPVMQIDDDDDWSLIR